MSKVRMTGETVKKMLKEAYKAGYEGCIEFENEEVEAIFSKYLKETNADKQESNKKNTSTEELMKKIDQKLWTKWDSYLT